MPSATSCSKGPNPWWNSTLYRKNLKRFWPIWASYGVILLLVPLTFLLTWLDRNEILDINIVAMDLLGFVSPMGLILSAVWSIVSAMAVFSYLYNSRSVQLYHALPIRREGLYLTNYLSGLSFLVLPLGVVFLFTLAVEAVSGTLLLWPLFQWLIAQVCFALFFYSFAAFCALFVGHIVALPVFYGILNFLAFGMSQLLSELFRQFVYGYHSWPAMSQLAQWLSPFIVLYREGGVRVADNGGYFYTGLAAALAYALAGLVLAAVGLLVYRVRPLETAGDVVAVKWVRPVFKYGVAFCAAVTIGIFLRELFRTLLPGGMWPMLGLMVLGGLIGYFAAEMLLRKTFRVLRRSWKGALALCLVLTAAALTMNYDLIGFNRAPSRYNVVSVYLWGPYTYPSDSASHFDIYCTDSEDIEAVLALHQAIARDQQELQDRLEHDRYSTGYDPENPDQPLVQSQNVYFSYNLADGSQLTREYTLQLYSTDLEDPDSVASLLNNIINAPDAIENSYFSGVESQDAFDSLAEASVENVYNAGSQTYDSLEVLSEADRNALLAAVRSDLAAGRLGQRYLFDDKERNDTCCLADLKLSFFKTIKDPDQYGQLWEHDWSTTVTIGLQITATDTIACLEELGLIDENHPLTTHTEDMLRSSGDPGAADTVQMEDSSTEAVDGGPQAEVIPAD
ncbi:hypothetical protein BACCAP_00338 [Pseudoflavonifractor capillosus ATCC 29799]|uniref:Uncharacterized protein n=1 Tax=Pseudoflavonifractor capillosus ATCC 29799 TaxID=411467 RepID=A6NQ68_9FIRM|nr:ABC-2 transporter permease [Pseudoflavonifractor capillosus]EDN01673.1 hypothetical protein BACCAP_00338 [Pseudoflavonifractor capillosus ATCC 29799]